MSMFTLTALALVGTGLTGLYTGRPKQRRGRHARHSGDRRTTEESRSPTGCFAARRRGSRHHLRDRRRAACR
jgi:hypothetical protein